ncbi:hypothetical protein O181_063917 [Austropuccinia psidii MF-1]|uniref:Uncharacterized protein n=1 Tax=Austropuccinia psidii MF-1 TaxID=1389203 RepID=A0A9Q3I1T6_9BASI|nr:hypothetical protein [Austropuccinia psidii MF-1]
MDLDQDIQFINQKDKNLSTEERNKWKMPELPQVPKAARVGTSAKELDRNNELLSSSKEAHGPRKDRGFSEGLETCVLQRTSPEDKRLVEKTNYFVRGPEEEVGPRKGQQPSGSYSSLHKKESASTSAKQGQESPREQSEGQEKGKAQVEKTLYTELQKSKERKDSHRQCVQYGQKSDVIQKQGGGKN